MRILLRALILILALPLASAPADEPAVPDLSGRWTLDPDKSEDGRQKMRDAMPTRVPGGGGGGGPRGGGPGGGGARGGGAPGAAVRPVVATRSARACAA